MNVMLLKIMNLVRLTSWAPTLARLSGVLSYSTECVDPRRFFPQVSEPLEASEVLNISTGTVVENNSPKPILRGPDWRSPCVGRGPRFGGGGGLGVEVQTPAMPAPWRLLVSIVPSVMRKIPGKRPSQGRFAFGMY